MLWSVPFLSFLHFLEAFLGIDVVNSGVVGGVHFCPLFFFNILSLFRIFMIIYWVFLSYQLVVIVVQIVLVHFLFFEVDLLEILILFQMLIVHPTVTIFGTVLPNGTTRILFFLIALHFSNILITLTDLCASRPVLLRIISWRLKAVEAAAQKDTERSNGTPLCWPILFIFPLQLADRDMFSTIKITDHLLGDIRRGLRGLRIIVGVPAHYLDFIIQFLFHVHLLLHLKVASFFVRHCTQVILLTVMILTSRHHSSIVIEFGELTYYSIKHSYLPLETLLHVIMIH